MPSTFSWWINENCCFMEAAYMCDLIARFVRKNLCQWLLSSGRERPWKGSYLTNSFKWQLTIISGTFRTPSTTRSLIVLFYWSSTGWRKPTYCRHNYNNCLPRKGKMKMVFMTTSCLLICPKRIVYDQWNMEYDQPLFVWLSPRENELDHSLLLSRDWPSVRTYASTDCTGGIGERPFQILLQKN